MGKMAKIIDLTGLGLKPIGMVKGMLNDPSIQKAKIVRVEKDKGCGSGFCVVVEISYVNKIEKFDMPWFKKKKKVK